MPYTNVDIFREKKRVKIFNKSFGGNELYEKN
jgi:hypothetical protein